MSEDKPLFTQIGDLQPGDLGRELDQLDPADSRIAELDIDQVAGAIDPKQLSKKEFVQIIAALNRLADGGAELDLSKMDPDNFARLISRASKDQIDGLMGKPELRNRILDEVFRRMEHHYRRDKAGSTKAVVHWRFSGGNGDDGFDRFESVLADGACKVNTEMHGKPRVTITVGPVDFMKLITRNASAPVLFMTGKLKVKGDLGFAAGLISLFDLPKG
jgi:putative sterol carrier protein